ncbi:hypothetical protein A1E_05170 [Rickettsia canadensis str. McKiel]|uniref:Uncharacterized protein n=2 Tax=Rickettsia canadensis TaxID=788 RepID=A8F017_RICCK|nr:hypothetical protein [Rickettsia canadensis]ABV73950.1 hypothetical protein A1E_05170 [Rickettsia canadensis str. McKiel]AFB21507.1 hypothetical protein RCA_04790 [Rickettsia canadensis str. CA410]
MIILCGSFAIGDRLRDLPDGYHNDTDIFDYTAKGQYNIKGMLL